ncbi:MAG: hypothetical protein AMJ43_08095 [Coxiella sp. DG_40]|nr:MAG: hypothetical protein AMJ43_08095 [Coxiella sp. DG_40]
MKKDSIVFLNICPIGKVFAESLGMDLFEEAGYRLIFLDMSKIFYPDTYKKFGSTNKDYVVKKEFFIECETRQRVLELIKEYSTRAWFYPLFFRFNLRLDKMWLMRAFKKYKCDYILQDFFPIPTGKGPLDASFKMTRHFITTFGQLIRKFKINDILARSAGWLSFFLMARNIFYRRPTHCFVAGNLMYDRFRAFYPKSNIVSVPSFDYYKYYCVISNLDKGPSQEIPKNDYLVYYDQSIFASPDAMLLNISVMGKAEYLKKINRFFDRIEDVTGKKVVIAASPKSRYEGDEFNGRKIIYNKTAELTYYSDLVIMHCTTAVNFAVATYKPILFLIIQGFNESRTRDINVRASALNKEAMNTAHNFDKIELEKLTRVEKNAYDNFINNYMTRKAFKVSPAQIMVETLKKYDVF